MKRRSEAERQKQLSLSGFRPCGIIPPSRAHGGTIEGLESRRLFAADFSLGLGFGGSGGDAAYDVASDSSGNMYVTGTFSGTADFDPSSATKNLTSAGGVDLFVAKFSSSGAIAWARRVGGTGDETPGGIALDLSGNVYVTGGFTGTADFDPSSTTRNLTSAGSTDIFAWRLTKDGNWSWAHRAGSTGADRGRDLAINPNGNVSVTGSFTGNVDFDFGSPADVAFSAGDTDAFLWTLTSTGSYVGQNQLGGVGPDIGNAIAASPATSGSTVGKVYIAGSFSGQLRVEDVGPQFVSAGGTDIFVWSPGADQGEGSFRRGGTGDDAGGAIAVDHDGNLYLAGTFSAAVDFDPGPSTVTLNSAGGTDAFVMMIGPAFVPASGAAPVLGAFQFARRAGSTANDIATGLAIDSAGSLYVSGSFQGTVDFDPSSNGATNRTSAGGRDGFAWKLTAGGELTYVRQFGGSGDDIASRLAVNSAGDVLIAGAYSGTVDLDPSSGTRNVTSKGSSDAFVSKLTSNTFDFGTAIKIGAGGIPTVISTAVDAVGNAYVLGDFDGTVDFDPGTGITELTDSSGQDRFIAKYTPQGTLVWAKAINVENADPETFTARDIAVDPAGNVVVTGDYVTQVQGFYDPEAYLSKYDVNGNFLWMKTVAGHPDAAGVAVATDAAGNVYFAGSMDFAGLFRFVQKRSAQGDLIWKYAPTFRVLDIAVDASGSVLLGGDNGAEFNEPEPDAGTDAFVTKLTPAGTPAFSKVFGGTGNDSIRSVAFDGAGNILLAGT